MLYVSIDNASDIYDRSRKDLELKTFVFGNVVNSIEKEVSFKEKQRDHN